jgi:hypothetical protein
MPTFTLSHDDCQQIAVAISSMLVPLERTAQLFPADISPDTVASISRYTRIRALLNDAGIVGTFSPAVALKVLDDLANNSAGMSLLFRQPIRSQDETEQAIRLQACKMLDGHRDQYGVQASKLTENGDVLREFLEHWNDPIAPLDAPGPGATIRKAGHS